jgi:hypothetical protein
MRNPPVMVRPPWLIDLKKMKRDQWDRARDYNIASVENRRPGGEWYVSGERALSDGQTLFC